MRSFLLLYYYFAGTGNSLGKPSHWFPLLLLLFRIICDLTPFVLHFPHHSGSDIMIELYQTGELGEMIEKAKADMI